MVSLHIAMGGMDIVHLIEDNYCCHINYYDMHSIIK